MQPPLAETTRPVDLDAPAEATVAPATPALLRLDAVGFSPAERAALRALLDHLGPQLGTPLALGGASSEVLALEAAHAAGLAPAALETLRAGRPLVVLHGADLLGGLRRAHDGRDAARQLRLLLQPHGDVR